MGRWLDALKKRENGLEANLQNPQNSFNLGFEGFESFNSTELQKNSNPKKIMETAPDGTDKTDNASQMVVSSVLSVPLGGENENFSGDLRRALEGEKGNGPLFFSHPIQENERRRIIPFPGRDWKPDTKIRPDDPERYADALRVHGPASYGMMMRILGWGGTRAGRAEDELQKQGRIAFDKRGFAVLIDQKGKSNE
ncbi:MULTISPECIES: hypothetical protein [Brucella]|nr:MULTISPECIES: hypothetical protein [Brucella]ERM86933.1 hypothetical protein P865_05465 [Brucella abortus 82]ERT85779.1 hypothetical protein P050_00956 [Brucella abortus 90-12178]ERT99103.1 hypothetical protein P038_01954 [Brucella abortus 99-9971-135]ERU11416.1 hypothetical protein P039_00111 [Brucella abortus 07-0994-2411]ACO00061.1 Hypothetical protein, conserved [Brucella melitensis ATCC 23457]